MAAQPELSPGRPAAEDADPTSQAHVRASRSGASGATHARALEYGFLYGPLTLCNCLGLSDNDSRLSIRLLSERLFIRPSHQGSRTRPTHLVQRHRVPKVQSGSRT